MSQTERPAAAPTSAVRSAPARRWWLRALAWAGGTLLAVGLCVAMLVAVALAVAYPNLPEINGLADYRPKLPLRVFSADGVLLGEFGEERRTFTPIAQIPKVMKDAVLAIEDARFYRHGGVDYVGVLRAGLAQFNKAKSQGASTITMQVARNFYLSTEKTFTRKIYEILLALKIERQLGKDQILELYMNQIFLGQRAYGFAAAAEIYYGKALKDLSVAEAAMLAGLPQAPSAYNPVSNPQRAKRRQQHIIDRMEANGFITEEQAERARAETPRLRTPTDNAVHAEFVTETVRQLVASQYGADTTTRGLNVTITIDSGDQAAAYRALRRGLLDYERRQHYRGPEGFVELPTDAAALDARVAEALAEHPDNDELKAAVVLEASPRKVLAVLQSGEQISVSGKGLEPVTSGLADKAEAHKQIRRGAVVRAVRGAKGDWTLTQLPEVEGAFVALDPRNGAIRALVGGFDFGKNKFNHVTQAWRQPGSSFKPFIYSAALEKGFTPMTVVNDAPLFFDAGTTGSQPWEPKNYDGKFEGAMALKTALAKSKNMVSIRVLQSTGVRFAQDWTTRFGFDADKHPAYLTMALGAGSVTPLQMASAYGVFASGGLRSALALITRIADAKGRVLMQAPMAPADESARAIDARNAFVMTQLMGEVTRSGTAAKVYQSFRRMDLYGKTGTTNDSMDAWFAGFQPNLVAVVWIGYDAPRKLGDRETGGGLALPVWIEFMQHALKKLPEQTLPVPEGLVQRGGDWVFEEFGGGEGISSVGLDDKLPKPASEEEKKGILDLFR
ncbi:penicillin-binding protein 1A [Aquabacterium sp. OR-4]|uniref:penicillin-binding protein 1A n=1 Tax=Aquabacterium sp. OR-4 TaxID=2978127 RepID=UPI0021B322FD|nr:PBP1A family penicillin-binding protein [Aquabacterium sp. OR-4]MDT7837577.1 PBP1A family penicillin-binding protein [Aquabacterium sp. OR-4]